MPDRRRKIMVSFVNALLSYLFVMLVIVVVAGAAVAVGIHLRKKKDKQIAGEEKAEIAEEQV